MTAAASRNHRLTFFFHLFSCMKLTEALRLKADYKRELESLTDRCCDNATKDSEDSATPSEDPVILLNQYRALNGKYFDLSTLINKTNVTHTVKYPSYYANVAHADLMEDIYSNEVGSNIVFCERPIMEALVERDLLKADIRRTQRLKDSTVPRRRTSVDDIKEVSVLDVERLQKSIDQMSKFLRLIDSRIQERNWTVEVDVTT
jgi:hypothetical protein